MAVRARSDLDSGILFRSAECVKQAEQVEQETPFERTLLGVCPENSWPILFHLSTTVHGEQNSPRLVDIDIYICFAVRNLQYL